MGYIAVRSLNAILNNEAISCCEASQKGCSPVAWTGPAVAPLAHPPLIPAHIALPGRVDGASITPAADNADGGHRIARK